MFKYLDDGHMIEAVIFLQIKSNVAHGILFIHNCLSEYPLVFKMLFIYVAQSF